MAFYGSLASMKYLKPFRFAFCLAVLFFAAFGALASYEAFRSINLVVENHTNRDVRFDFDREPSSPLLFLLKKRGTSYLGLGTQHLPTKVYVEGSSQQSEIACPAGAEDLRVMIREGSLTCQPFEGKLARWVATFPVSKMFWTMYGQMAKELLIPAV